MHIINGKFIMQCNVVCQKLFNMKIYRMKYFLHTKYSRFTVNHVVGVHHQTILFLTLISPHI